MSSECEKWLERTANEFMVPVAEFMSAEEAAECQEAMVYGEEGEAAQAGWYSRLSAPGYLDCTEWNGPHANEHDALVALWEEHDDGWDDEG